MSNDNDNPNRKKNQTTALIVILITIMIAVFAGTSDAAYIEPTTDLLFSTGDSREPITQTLSVKR